MQVFFFATCIFQLPEYNSSARDFAFDKFEKGFTSYLRKTISIRDNNVRKEMKENFYHGILLGLFAGMDGHTFVIQVTTIVDHIPGTVYPGIAKQISVIPFFHGSILAGKSIIFQHLPDFCIRKAKIKKIKQELTYRDLDSGIDNLWSVLFTTGYTFHPSIPANNPSKIPW